MSDLPPLPPTGREVMEELWQARGPLTTRQVHDRVTLRNPERRGRAINTTSTILTGLFEGGR